MSRPGIEFVDDLQIVFMVAFLARKDAELFAGSEKRDRNYKSAGELEGVVLRKPKIVIPARIANTTPRQWRFWPAAERQTFSSASTR
ncbi:hypothetical protein [Phyllobacterium zundukense]|uniref:hypothetical protein n=1 Tax=Phyllobacterium zundukense TaxID=1867719 RepID=UPI002905676D|nr:hypothetical protein [Phyllobacterium zundukense]